MSYSHDSEVHKGRILGLADPLRQDGVDTRIDRYVEGTLPKSWARWMVNEIEDLVLVVCTEALQTSQLTP